jgi:L-threonylcarbamoyladenylate synthase
MLKDSYHMLITKEKAIEQLRNGQTVAIPTETVYGLAARYDNKSAVEAIFSVKERPFFDPLICHISNVNMLDLLVTPPNSIAKKLIATYWPGPLTLVLPKKPEVNDMITSGLTTVAVRMPKHKVALEIIEGVGVPLCAPSANKFGKTSPTSGRHVEEEFSGQVGVVDAGDSSIGIESTIVRVLDNKLEVLRPGRITASELQVLFPEIEVTTIKNDKASPGHVEHHYQPEKPFYLVSETKLSSFPHTSYTQWKMDENPLIAARRLYADMRDYSRQAEGFYCIRENRQNNNGLWDAIWNRLEKASLTKEYI